MLTSFENLLLTQVSVIPKPARKTSLGAPNRASMLVNSTAVFTGTASPPEMKTLMEDKSSGLVSRDAKSRMIWEIKKLGLKV